MSTRTWASFWLAGAITAVAGCSDRHRSNEDGGGEAGQGGHAGAVGGSSGGSRAGSAGTPQGGSQGETGGNGANAGSSSNGGTDTGGTDAGGASTGGMNTAGAGASGGASTGGSGSGGSGGDMCGRPQVLLVIDRSISMNDNEVASGVTRWQAVVDGVSQAVTSIASVDWGIKLFPETDDMVSSCAFDNVTNLVHLPIAADTAEAARELLALTIANGSGTPTGQAIVMSTEYLDTLDTRGPRRLVLITDDTPNCEPTSIEPNPDAGLEFALETLIASRDFRGYFTCVIGVGVNTEAADAALSYMADAGGCPALSASPLDPLYYAANNSAVIATSLQTIAAEAACP